MVGNRAQGEMSIIDRQWQLRLSASYTGAAPWPAGYSATSSAIVSASFAAWSSLKILEGTGILWRMLRALSNAVCSCASCGDPTTLLPAAGDDVLAAGVGFGKRHPSLVAGGASQGNHQHLCQ